MSFAPVEWLTDTIVFLSAHWWIDDFYGRLWIFMKISDLYEELQMLLRVVTFMKSFKFYDELLLIWRGASLVIN